MKQILYDIGPLTLVRWLFQRAQFVLLFRKINDYQAKSSVLSPYELQGGDDGDGGDVPDLVHLVAQRGSELDPKCDT